MKSKIALITLALAGAACAAWTPKDSAVDYPTMTVPAAGDAIPIWDAGTDATQQIFWSTFVSSFQGLDADLTTWAGVTPGTGIGAFLTTPSSANLTAALTDESGTGVILTANGVGAALTVTASGFNGNLATTDDTVQEIAQKLDDLTASSGSVATDTIFDAAGDIVQGTGANTSARLPIGTAGQLLKVNAGATALEYTSSIAASTIDVSGSVTATSLEFEGATADAFETALGVVDPTADRGILLPDASGTIVVTGQQTDAFIIAISDETTAHTTGTAKVTFRAPYAFTITSVKGSLTTVSSSGVPTWDINETGTTILSTKLTIDASEKTSTTAATAAVVSDAAIAADAEITIDIDTAGTGAAGGKITIIHQH